MLIKSSVLSKATEVSWKNSRAFEAAGQAVAELFTAGCIGSACAQQGYLDAATVQSLSKVCFTILLPMFLSTSIMNTINKYGFKFSSILVPLIAVSHVLILYAISRYLLLPCFGIDTDSIEGRATNVCCAFGNAGVLPLIFVEALFRNSHIFPRASSIVSMYLVGWSPLFWSFGRNVLLGGKEDFDKRLVSESQHGKNTFSFRDKILMLKPFFPPPVVGVTIGFLLALSPKLRCLFMKCQTDQKRAPFEVVYHSVSNLGRAANPIALLVLTSSLALGVSQSQTDETATKVTDSHTHTHVDTNQDTSISLIRQWSCVSTARFLISPLLMIGILQFAHQCGLIGSMTDGTDSFLQWFILILESTMPAAQNSVLLLQVAKKRSEASHLAKFLFTIYATAMLPLVIVATL